MKLILFSKSLKDKSIEELISLAHDFNFDGYDLCVRPDYQVNPDNASEKLPETVKLLNTLLFWSSRISINTRLPSKYCVYFCVLFFRKFWLLSVVPSC